MSTYGIYRGFLLHRARHGAARAPSSTPPGSTAWSISARPITLEEIAERGRFDFMVTGASAVSIDGVRFGKGHGFFDLEWGMFTDLGLVDEATPVVAVVHDVQVVEDKLHPSETDILVDYIATPTPADRRSSGAPPPARHQVGPARARTDRRDAAAAGTAAHAGHRVSLDLTSSNHQQE